MKNRFFQCNIYNCILSVEGCHRRRKFSESNSFGYITNMVSGCDDCKIKYDIDREDFTNITEYFFVNNKFLTSNKREETVDLTDPNYVICPKCKKEKHINQMRKDIRKKNIYPECKECRNTRERKRRYGKI